ncbi:MAG: DUF11 domain-containing protein [Sphingomonadales bacterium]|nr:DUF11 domain-containing protein [Sphingomonadales bacterium]
MKNVTLRSAASILAIATMFGAGSAHATGVTAGTLIQNTASATYNSGSETTTVTSNTVDLRVDELLDVAVAPLDAAPQPLGSGTTVLTYSVTNTGNGSEAFNLTANPAVSGNAFDAVIQTVAIDSNGNGVYDPGVDTVVPNGSASTAVAPDASLTVFVVVTLPAGAADNAASQVRLTATAVTGTGSPGTVLTGQGAGGGDAVVGSTTAQDDGLGSLISRTAAVTLTKSYTVADPFGGTQPVPGAIVTYTIRADIAGTGQVSNLHVTDIIPAGTTYQAGTLKLDAGALTDGADADAGTASAAGIDVNIGTQNGGTSRTVTFQTRIN